MALTKVGLDLIDASGKADDKYLKGDGTWGTIASTDTTGIEDDIALLGFKVALNGSMAKYNLVNQTEDAFYDATGIDAGDSTNATWNAAKYVSGTSGGSVTATGGTITTDEAGAYTIHSFNNASSPKTFTTDTAQDVEILLIGGGGAGSNDYGGGGGAGGVIAHPSFAVSAGSHSIVIGTGGAATTSIPGPSGLDSTFSTLTAVGGGGGGGWTPVNGVNGGSGGGGARAASAGNGGSGTQTSPAGGTGYGNDGADGSTTVGAGGGGGAGAAGSARTGGDGIESDIYQTGVNVYYAGGGGGGNTPSSNSSGGAGGGGYGANGNTNQAGGAATADTGSGGGGGAGGGGALGGAGANGLFVLRRPTSSLVISDMTLVSEFTEAEAAPTKGDLVMTYTTVGGGSTTVGTDLTAEVSADDGSTWTDLGLVTGDIQGTTGGHTIISKHDVTISSTITAPYKMRYRIKTLNQAAAKETRIQAVSLGRS